MTNKSICTKPEMKCPNKAKKSDKCNARGICEYQDNSAYRKEVK